MTAGDAEPSIRPELPADQPEVREVHTLAFGGGDKVPALIDALRVAAAPLPPISPRYYGARGFETASAAGFRSPSLRIPDTAFQVARLSAYEPWMTGTFVYSETFWALDAVGLRAEDRATQDG